MANEIELKIDVTPVQMGQLKRAAWLRRYADGPGEDKSLVSVYYDTDELALRKRQSILRICDSDGQFTQTFKAEDPACGNGFPPQQASRR